MYPKCRVTQHWYDKILFVILSKPITVEDFSQKNNFVIISGEISSALPGMCTRSLDLIDSSLHSKTCACINTVIKNLSYICLFSWRNTDSMPWKYPTLHCLMSLSLPVVLSYDWQTRIIMYQPTHENIVQGVQPMSSKLVNRGCQHWHYEASLSCPYFYGWCHIDSPKQTKEIRLMLYIIKN